MSEPRIAQDGLQTLDMVVIFDARMADSAREHLLLSTSGCGDSFLYAKRGLWLTAVSLGLFYAPQPLKSL
jgi:hypothetical protein